MIVHLPHPDIQLRNKVWSDDVFAEIEKAGGVQLNAQQRLALQADVEDYEENSRRWKAMCDADPNYRKRLDHLIKKLGETVKALEASERVGAIVLWRAGLNLEDETARLKSLRQHCVDVRQELAGQGRNPNIFLPEILGRLESLFLDAGGASTAVSRPTVEVGYRTRESPFISFAWAVFLQAPEPIRPLSGQALAVAWERIQQKAKPRASQARPLTPT